MEINPLWYLCLLIRFSMVLSILYISTLKNNKLIDIIISFILLLMGIGFIYKSFTGSNNEIQVAKVFWHNSRIYHGILFILATYFYFKNQKKLASLVILLDIVFSFVYRISNKL